MTARVSVVLTSYNHAPYIQQAIDSVLAQTYSDYELIIWDDFSTDNSWEVIRSNTDPRIKPFRNETYLHGGSLQKAISGYARGEYVAILHSDDLWQPGKLEAQVEYLDAHPEIGACFTGVKMIDDKGNWFNDPMAIYAGRFDQPNRSRYEWLRTFFYQGNVLCHPSCLIRRKCYDDCGLYREGLAQLPDLDMWVRLCLKYEIQILPEQMTSCRIHAHEANASGNRPETRIRAQYEFIEVLRNYRQIRDYTELHRVFPEISTIVPPACRDVDYILARLALQNNSSFVTAQLFGQELLFEILNNPIQADQLVQTTGFGRREFIELTGRNDIFNVAQESIRLDRIRKSWAWPFYSVGVRIYRKLRRLRWMDQ